MKELTKTQEIARLKAEHLVELDRRKSVYEENLKDVREELSEEKLKFAKQGKELTHQLHRHEQAKMNLVRTALERDLAKAEVEALRAAFGKQLQKVLETGYRRASVSPAYKVVRELVNDGHDFTKIDWAKFAESHPEVALHSLVQEAEIVTGIRVEWTEEMKKNYSGIAKWQINATYTDILKDLSMGLKTEIEDAEDKKVTDAVRKILKKKG